MRNTFRTGAAILFAIIFICSSCKKESSLVTKSSGDTNISPPVTPVAQPPVNNETQPANQIAITYNVNANIGGFYQALPAKYDSTSLKYPLLVFLHGVGELGNGSSDLLKVLNNAVPRLLNLKTFPPQFIVNGTSFSFVVVSPQFKQWPQPADVNVMVDYAIAHYRIDTTKIYVCGLSMGGGAVWDYGIAYTKRIAAIVPISGASWPTRDQCRNIANGKLPVWAFHNLDDGTVGSGTTTYIVDNINSFSPEIPAMKTIWPTGGHDAWTKATNPDTKECNGKNMYEWMLQYTRLPGQ